MSMYHNGDVKPGHSAINFKKIPTAVRNRFKAYCAERGISMVDAVVGFMKECIKREDSPIPTGKPLRADRLRPPS
jgi:antitoxin component of RelBE/YafQ-DinJ toxin-antitoxin module